MTPKEGLENFKTRNLSREEEWGEVIQVEVAQNAILNVLDGFRADISGKKEVQVED